MHGLVANFRIYPNTGAEHYYEVVVFDTRERMYRHLSRQKLDPMSYEDASGYLAVCLHNAVVDCRKGRTEKIKPRIGRLVFYARYLPIWLAAHEIVHAATQWALVVKGFTPDEITGDACQPRTSSSPEEIFAGAIEGMVQQFWKRYYGHIRTHQPFVQFSCTHATTTGAQT